MQIYVYFSSYCFRLFGSFSFSFSLLALPCFGLVVWSLLCRVNLLGFTDTNSTVSTTDTPLIIGRDLINALELGVQGSPMVHGVQQNVQPESCTTSPQLAEVYINEPSPLQRPSAYRMGLPNATLPQWGSHSLLGTWLYYANFWHYPWTHWESLQISGIRPSRHGTSRLLTTFDSPGSSRRGREGSM